MAEFVLRDHVFDLERWPMAAYPVNNVRIELWPETSRRIVKNRSSSSLARFSSLIMASMAPSLPSGRSQEETSAHPSSTKDLGDGDPKAGQVGLGGDFLELVEKLRLGVGAINVNGFETLGLTTQMTLTPVAR